MSYNQSGQQGYGQYNPYGQEGNPYAQQDQPYSDQGNPYGGQQPSYGGPQQPQQQGSGYYDQDVEQRAGGYEMSNMNGNDPNRMLNEVRAIDREVDNLQGDLERLKSLQSRFVNAPDQRQIDALKVEIEQSSRRTMDAYKGLTNRVKNLKQSPESGNARNAPQIGKVDRRLRTMIKEYQKIDVDHRNAIRERNRRDYLIVRPDASEAEIREVTEDTSNTQVFSQALLNSDRRGQAQSVASAVQSRHEAIQKIERDLIELAQMFQDLEAAVIQQEPAVTQIEQRGEEVTEHVAKANTELTGAVVKAKAARRKKWWCLGIVVLIIIIIAVVVAVAVTVTRN